MTWKKLWHIHSGKQNATSIFDIWMYLQAGKIKRILCFYWPLWYDEPILRAVSCKKTFIFGHIKMNPLLTKLVQSSFQDIVLNGFYFCSWPRKIMLCSHIIVIFAKLKGKNNGFPFLDIFGYLKNIHKNPKFGKVRQVPTREFPTKFPDWDLSHSSKFGIFVGIL